ncbi:MAG: hypothetical protein NWF14_06075 [Candidatus Bathyarchaeota archaeon]|nr:hypothetical protein [Candidatus Bathyarchaeota archaeon]
MTRPETDRRKTVSKFPKRIYTLDEVSRAKTLIDEGHRHRLQVLGNQTFKEKAREALSLVQTAGYYDFLRTYIRTIREIDGISQIREAEASIWANIYAVEEPVGAARFFVQKAWQMRNYVEGKVYYGHQGETLASDAGLTFLKALGRRTIDPKVKDECRRRIKIQEESKFL